MGDMKVKTLLIRISPVLKAHKNSEKVRDFLFDMLLLRQASLEAEKGNIYFPPDLNWDGLKRQMESKNPCYSLRDRIYDALCFMDRIPEYGGIIDWKEVPEELDDQELSVIFDSLGQLSWDGNEEADSEPAYFFEFLTGYMASESPKQMGEFYTPRQVGELIVKLLDTKGGSVYDPCCGSGGMLVCAADYMRKGKGGFRLYGQESDGHAWKTARINLILRGTPADLGPAPADSMREDMHPDLKTDYVLGNPPFRRYGQSSKWPADDRRWRYGVPSEKKADFAWMQHMLYHLNENGKMGAIFSNGTLNSRRTGDRRIRAGIVEDDILEAVITLPAGMFYTTKVSVSLWIFNKKKKALCRNKLLLVNAREFGKVWSGITVLSDEDMRVLLQAYENYQNGIDTEQWDFCRQISAEEIKAQDYSLAPERYILPRQQKLPELEALEERQSRLEMKLKGLLEENRRVLGQIV